MSWISWGMVIFLIPPDCLASWLSFYLSLAGAVFFLGVLILKNNRQSFLLMTGTVAFFILRQIRLAGFINLSLVFLFLITSEIYLKQKAGEKAEESKRKRSLLK